MQNMYRTQPQQYYPMDGSSPLGLKLKKRASMVELIQTYLVQNMSTPKLTNTRETISPDQKESKSLACINDKLKASNIPALLLKIGNWEYKSRNESDLVAKCYFAKHKLVWEVLEAGLKSKIEIQWSDIAGLKADCPEIGESSLKLVLSRQPLFFSETNPQPRKHTLWQPCSDFTGGEATLNRFHFLKFPQRTLQKHYEKLIQSDSRLDFLSRQPDMVMDSPHFEGGPSSVLKELDSKSHFVDPIKAGESALSAGYPDVLTAIQPSFFKNEQQSHGGIILERPPVGIFSPNSVIAVNPIEEFKNQTGGFQVGGNESIDQFKEPAELLASMSTLDAVKIPSDADSRSAESVQQHKDQLEHLAEYLLNDNDSNIPIPTDEIYVMESVNSLCSLIQKDNLEGSNNHWDIFLNPSTMEFNQNTENLEGVDIIRKPSVFESICGSGWDEPAENQSMTPATPTGTMKQDSFNDLLFNLPHITSPPKFMNFSENNLSHFN